MPSDARDPTIFDIAQLAKVSPSIVSKVLNDAPDVGEATRAKVLRIMDELDFVPRRGKASANLIAFVTPMHSTEFRSAFVSGVFDGIVETAADHGYMAVVIPDKQLRAKLSEARGGIRHFMRQTGVCGLFLRVRSQNDPLLEAVLEQRVPHVLINRKFERESLHYVAADGYQGAYHATRHLLQLGHRRIALIGDPRLVSESFSDRIIGYEAAFRDADLEPDPDLLFMDLNSYEASAGRQAAMELCSRQPRPTAAITFFRPLATGFLSTLQQLGVRMPGDLSVVTFDEIPGSEHFDPPLSAVEGPSYEIGRHAVEALMRQVGGESSPTRVVLPMRLIVRASSAPLVGPEPA